MKSIRLIALFITLSTLSLAAQTNRIALIQSEFVWGDTQANIAAFQEKILSIDRCDIIILPELFASGCDMQKRDKQVKEAAKIAVAAQYESITSKIQWWAKETGAVIVGSTIYQEADLFYNRLLVAYPSGELLHYDKHNCFKMGSFTPGSDHLVFEVNGHRFATYICYDLRFEEWSRNNGRYDSAIYIANWPTSRAEDWSALLHQRAIENQAHVIGVNCVGKDNAGVEYMGESSFFAPDGSLITKGANGKEDIIIIEYTN
ncbi:MAG: nitrilase-related carbon-nitrogen hydrolase [Rikenellaceae bacterium]